ncbi:hypothetical protein [Streptomyces sp. A5-4]|uniref:hypothetical protein n=1 Tax=Streptomyces sp. A5-4 TaxID=3384771 RepID=UPI003DAA3E44
MTGVSVAERLAAGGLQQHMFAEPTAVAEECKYPGQSCWFDSDCCNPRFCEWWTCRA